MLNHTKLRAASAGVALGLSLGVMSAAVAPVAHAAPTAPAASVQQTASQPVTGTLPDGSAFTGAISNLQVSKVGQNAMQLTGTITGTGLPAGGTTFAAPIQGVTTPQGCQVLNLDLGPLHLDLLGLVVDLAPVNLDITAVPGAGNLLGNLVCAVAGLLDQNAPAGGLAGLLNRLLTGLGLA